MSGVRTALAVLALAVSVGIQPSGQTSAYNPAPENLKAREWFQDARFGLFIHWGVYSLMADGEWVMNNRQIPAADYEKLAAFFNPIRLSSQLDPPPKLRAHSFSVCGVDAKDSRPGLAVARSKCRLHYNLVSSGSRLESSEQLRAVGCHEEM